MDKKTFFNKILNFYTIIGFFLIFTSVALTAIPIFPYVWYRINPKATEQEIETLQEEVVQETPIEEKEPVDLLPELDPTLPKGYYINIDKISVLSPISDNPDYDQALQEGAWIVPEYGTPEKDTLPIIIAAHRFGYQYWSREERELISFYNLPSTKSGDNVEIYWNQRKYTYQIYKSEESTYISEYDADLILYTCKYFNSPLRIFRYANLVAQE